MTAIKVQNLIKTFPGSFPHFARKKALQGVSFEVPARGATGFIGVNGAGKTTTIKIILDFIRPDSGSVEFLGKGKIDAQIKQKIGFLPERPYYYEYLTGLEFLKFHWSLAGGLQGESFAERADEVLRKVGLVDVKNFHLRSYSKGMLQRIGLAQAILMRPRLLILDEPMSGLDPDGRVLIKEIMKEQLQDEVALFFSSHLLQDMEEICQNLVVIDGGKCIFQGSVGEMLQKSKPKVRVSYLDGGESFERYADVEQEVLNIELAQLISSGAKIQRVVPNLNSLEQAFINMRSGKEV